MILSRNELKVTRKILELPRADLVREIKLLEKRQKDLLNALQPTTLNLKSFIPLLIKYKLSPEYPLDSIQRYLHEENIGVDHLRRLDRENRKNLEDYKKNIHAMEELTRIQVNLGLLKKHHKRNVDSGKKNVKVESG